MCFHDLYVLFRDGREMIIAEVNASGYTSEGKILYAEKNGYRMFFVSEAVSAFGRAIDMLDEQKIKYMKKGVIYERKAQ